MHAWRLLPCGPRSWPCLLALVLLLSAGSSPGTPAAIAEPPPTQAEAREGALALAHEYLVGSDRRRELSASVNGADTRPSQLALRCLQALALYCSGGGVDRQAVLDRQAPLLSILEAPSTQLDARFLRAFSWFNVLIAVLQSDDPIPQRYENAVQQSCNALLELQGEDGLWRSASGRVDPAGTTLAALLGLWAGSHLGATAPSPKLRIAASGLIGLSRQCDADCTGFVSEQSVGSHVEGHDTAAGVLGLLSIAHMLGSQGEDVGARVKRTIEGGLLWIHSSLDAEWNPAWHPEEATVEPTPDVITFVGAPGGHMEWLFRVVLLTACLDLEDACGQDVAGICSRYLVSAQQDNGSWLLKRDARSNQGSGLYPESSMRLRSTCLGVLALAGDLVSRPLMSGRLEVIEKPRVEERAAPPEWAHVSSAQLEASARHGVPVAVENRWKMRFVLIPAGRYRTGSPPEETGRVLWMEEPRTVLITKPLYMQISEVTNDAYGLFRRDHDSGESGGHQLSRGDQPVVWVSWEDARAFAEWLTREDSRLHYRLPSEAEWEWACRAGSTSRWSWGDSDTAGAAHANARGRGTASDWDPLVDGWREDDGYHGPAPVCSYAPNQWGMYDMHGNVAEYCLDYLEVSGRAPLLIDPCVCEEEDARSLTMDYLDRAGTSHQYVGRLRACRGGCWASSAGSTRCAVRDGWPPSVGHWAKGFRLVATFAQASDVK